MKGIMRNMTGVNINRNTRRRPAMFPKAFRKVSATLKEGLSLNKARADCLSAFIITAVEAKSILLDDTVKRLPGSAKGKSKFRRLQDFFCEVRPDYSSVALMIMGFVARLTDKSLVLSMDRTGWKTRGGHEYNLLVLSVCLGDMGLPVLWCDLRRLGNSTARKRKRLVQRFIRLFGVERIRCLIGDREFIGAEWFDWLQEEHVPFLMRLRHDIRIANTQGGMTPGRDLFRHLRVGEVMDLGSRRAFKTTMGICATRIRSGELLILGYHAGLDGPTALAMYRQRWNIETGFEKFKTHGFNLESSRLRGGGKMERVLAALSLAAAWSYAGGAWSVRVNGPIKLKKHGRREHSVFRRGLELLGGFFHGIAVDLRRTEQAVFGLLRMAARGVG